MYRYMVSIMMRAREKPAAVAKGFAATVLMVLRYAPRAGPKVNAIYMLGLVSFHTFSLFPAAA